jgi:parallel beta-helix repeat protein
MQDSQLANNLVSCLTLSDFSNVILTNNTFNSNNDTAIYLSDVLNTQITGNTINDSNAGIYITGTTPTGYILKNDFLNNTNYAINVDTSGDPLDVSGNWFGDINQPTSPTVQGNVTFSSWLGVSSGAIPLTWYTNSTIGTAPRRNIGDTISNASSGDIINILTGSYNENVVINKQLNIYFPSDGMCTLNNVMATAPVSLNGNCQATSAPTSFIFFEPVVVIDNLKLLATSNAIEANATIIFNNTLNARWYPADKTGGCNITLAANKLNVNNFVGGYVPFNIIDVSTIPCPNITNKQYYIGYNVIISACAFPWPTSPKNPSNAMNSNFGTMKIISSNAEIQNIINDAQKRYLEKLQKEKQKNEKKSDK